MSKFSVLLPLLLLSASCQADPILGDLVSPTKEDATTGYRLPKNAAPSEYVITLEPDFSDFSFTGESKITVAVTQKTNTLTLNSKNLTIDQRDIKLTHSEKDKIVEVTVTGRKFDDEKEFLIITFDKELEPKTYTLSLIYKGKLNDELRGFYRSSYLDEKGNKKWLATTHFEPTGARLAFPCWDEPAYKATFTISLKHPSEYTAISNMPTADPPKVYADKITTQFQKTPKMSTYLVAFVVSDYQCKDKTAKFRVWTKPHALKNTEFALEIGQKELDELDKYTGIKYSEYMPKMDQISIPDFSAGAMENWGLVTYRESSLLYEEGVTTTRSKQGIATVISHEFAHQWFGNLVSPTWWKYIWLNEGFATYFQYYITDKVEPTWRLMETFVVEALQGTAFVVDASENTRPMNQDAESPKSIRGLFDSIAYQKAGSVIRMMSHILKEDKFQEGIKDYLKDNKLGVADSDTLFKALKKQNADIDKIMDEWVNKEGYPVIDVKRDTNGRNVEITQERFSFSQTEEDTKWWIPITYTTGKNPDFENTTVSLWLGPGVKTLTVQGIDADTWMIFNIQQTGYYRVNYADENWVKLTEHLKSEKYTDVHPLNRAQLIDDSLNLARAGRVNYSIALSLVNYLNKEKDYIPWVSAFRNYNFLNSMLSTSDQYDAFKLFVKYTMKELVDTVKFEDVAEKKNDEKKDDKKDDDKKDDEKKDEKKSEHTTKLLRINMLKWACSVGMKECTEHVEKKFQSWLTDSKKNPLDVDLRDQILCAGVRTADNKTWNKVLTKYIESKDDAEKKVLLSALGCSDSEEILRAYLLLPFVKKTDMKDFDAAFNAVVSNSPKGVDIALDVLVNNYKNITELVTDSNKIESYPQKIGNLITTEKQYVKLGAFMTRHSLSAELQRNALKGAGKNLDWADLHRREIEGWLDTNQQVFNSASNASLAMLLGVIAMLFTRFF